jgi:hypothetical protein
LDPEENCAEEEEDGAGEEEYAADGCVRRTGEEKLMSDRAYTTAWRPEAPPQPMRTMEKVNVEITKLPWSILAV